MIGPLRPARSSPPSPPLSHRAALGDRFAHPGEDKAASGMELGRHLVAPRRNRAARCPETKKTASRWRGGCKAKKQTARVFFLRPCPAFPYALTRPDRRVERETMRGWGPGRERESKNEEEENRRRPRPLGAKSRRGGGGSGGSRGRSGGRVSGRAVRSTKLQGSESQKRREKEGGRR